MIEKARSNYNTNFSDEKYNRFIEDSNSDTNHKIEFKICETPVFIPADFRDKLITAGNEIIDIICQPDFINATQKAIPEKVFVPGEEGRPVFIALDFGICENEQGELLPQLIEMQGFASLYAWQHALGTNYRIHFEIPDNVSHLFNGLDENAYIELLKTNIIGDHDPKNVIVLEIEPTKQKTWIDFFLTQNLLGIKAVCISEIIKEGNTLFYIVDEEKIQIKRIYNRLIFDELEARPDLKCTWNLTDPVDVEWVCHPNWFFRISKYTLPFIKSRYVPETYFLNALKTLPADLENYVLKPLFSFAGHGVIFNITPESIDKAMLHAENYILQRKATYKPVIQTLDDPAKCEIRLMYIWEKNEPRPTLVINLARLSKGVMIGVDFNKNKTWVGGTVGYFEK